MTPLLAAAADALGLLERHGIPACVVGGLAVARWGEPRLTSDVDLVALTAIERDEEVIDLLLGSLEPRMPDARDFAVAHRTLLVRDARGIPIDIALGALEFERAMIERSSLWVIDDGPPVRTASAEDLLVMKAFAGRDRDWSDIAGIVARQGSTLDRTATLERLRPLAEFASDPEALVRLEAILARSS
jgi:hypothetical protein